MHAVPLHHHGLELRLWQPCDASALVEAAQESIDTVGRWMDDWCTPAFDNDNATNWFAYCKMHADMGMAYEFGLFCAESGRLLGGAGLNRIDTVNRLCNLGYWVRQSAQRQGVAARCVQALQTHAFSALGMQRVEIVVAVGNTASAAVAHKAGAKLECVARNRLQLHGQAVAAQVFSLVPPTMAAGLKAVFPPPAQ